MRTASILLSTLLACTLAACGGGGGGSAPSDTAPVAVGTSSAAAATVQPGVSAVAPVPAEEPTATTTTPGTTTPTGTTTPAPLTRPDIAVATVDEIAAWNQQCQTARCMIMLPERSGRSLNWWGTDPRVLEQENETCSPQTSCRIPDGDLLVWNFQCSPQPTCRVKLSRPY